MLNKVMIIGHVGQEPEVRYVGEAGNGTKVATMRVATTERYKDKSGETKERTEWHNVVLWRGLADIVEKYIKKGSKVYVEGKLQTRIWEDQSGQKRSSVDIVAEKMEMLGGKSEAQPTAPQKPQAKPQPAPAEDNPADDLPF